jgi:hypothetical protein
MPEIKKELNINFGIRKISIIDFLVESSQFKSDPKKPEFTFNFELGFKFNPKRKEVIFLLFFKVSPEKDQKLIVGKMRTEMIFFINNMEGFLHPKEAKINLPDQFMASLIGIVISTSRGLWSSKVVGTALQNAILPIINPSEFLAGLKKQSDTNGNNKTLPNKSIK